MAAPASAGAGCRNADSQRIQFEVVKMGVVTGIEERLMIYLHPGSDGAEAVWLNVREFCKRHRLVLILHARGGGIMPTDRREIGGVELFADNCKLFIMLNIRFLHFADGSPYFQ